MIHEGEEDDPVKINVDVAAGLYDLLVPERRSRFIGSTVVIQGRQGEAKFVKGIRGIVLEVNNSKGTALVVYGTDNKKGTFSLSNLISLCVRLSCYPKPLLTSFLAPSDGRLPECLDYRVQLSREEIECIMQKHLPPRFIQKRKGTPPPEDNAFPKEGIERFKLGPVVGEFSGLCFGITKHWIAWMIS